MPFAQGFGWGAELNLDYTFEKLFSTEMGGGYPKERVVPEQRNKKILDEVKKITHHDIMYVLENIDQDFLKTTVSSEKFKELFFANCQVPEIADYIKKLSANNHTKIHGLTNSILIRNIKAPGL